MFSCYSFLNNNAKYFRYCRHTITDTIISKQYHFTSNYPHHNTIRNKNSVLSNSVNTPLNKHAIKILFFYFLQNIIRRHGTPGRSLIVTGMTIVDMAYHASIIHYFLKSNILRICINNSTLWLEILKRRR